MWIDCSLDKKMVQQIDGLIDKWFNRKIERTIDYFQNLLLSGGGHQKMSGFEGCCWPEWVYVYVLVGPAHHNGACA